jgi:hypothetical protein
MISAISCQQKSDISFGETLLDLNVMGRRQINDEQMPARFPAGTFERMDAVLRAREKRSELLRIAIERELARRERRKPKQARQRL